ncbi:hypothetical protein M8Q70_003609 [Salmonella enterica]|nr:hypothetical protein [Salmonella enterica]EJF1559722.1 hypothetical protein [Salmonella enterica]EJF4886175.1 hypothetical protein [Salmonella enterica]
MKISRFSTWVCVAGWFLAVVFLVPAHADVTVKGGTGTVSFTGILLGGRSTCTLVNAEQNVDFGDITLSTHGYLNDPLVPPRRIAFRLTGCSSSVSKVKMSVVYSAGIHTDDGFIPATYPQGVGGGLKCPADAAAQGISGCPGTYINSTQFVEGQVSTSGEVSFPLDVYVRPNPVSQWLDLGYFTVPVSFVFEEE